MARDLTREARQPSRNGDQAAAAVDSLFDREDAPASQPEAQPGPIEEVSSPTAVMAARRDWVLARVALMLIDAAKLLDPLTRIVVNRIMPPLSLAASAGICSYAIAKTEGWERVAVAGIFTLLAALWVRKGQS